MRKKTESKKRYVWAAIAAVLCLIISGSALTACHSDTKVVLTTGFKKNEVFKIGSASCTLPEMRVYLSNLQNRYEAVFGEEIWKTKDDNETLEQEVKQQVLAQLAQVKAMNLLAEQKGIELDEKEKERAAAAAREYFTSLNETEVTAFGVDETGIEQMYREYALAGKVYRKIVENVNPEISDDEARTITVLAIHVQDFKQAGELCEKAKQEGSDFESLAENNSEDAAISYSFGKGEMEEAFEKAAFDLGKDEISDVVTASDGYYVLKCTSTFNEVQTQLNKEKIAEKRRNEAFGNEYNAFVNSLTRQLNEELFDSITFLHDENVKTSSFFTVYNTFFQAKQ